METQGKDAVILVFSTSHAMRLERIMKEGGIACRMIPVPRQLSSDCGVCVRIDASDVENAKSVISHAKFEIEGLHLI